MSDKKLPVIQSQNILNDDQSNFNEYILQINELKIEIARVEKQVKEAKVRIDQEITPLQELVVDYRVAFVELLDKASDMFYFSMLEKRQMKEMILEESFTLISQAEREHLKAIHDKYTDTPYDKLEQKAQEETSQSIRQFVEDNFDLETSNLEQESWTSLEELSKQLPKVTGKEAFESNVADFKKQSRVLYAHLAKELHPDTENNAQKKAEKTSVMQKLTEAYQAHDFFELLRMQAFYLPDQSAALPIDQQQLPLYNEALRRQLMELKVKLKVLKQPPEPMLNVYEDYCGETEDELEAKFTQKRLAWEKDLKAHKEFMEQVTDRYHLRMFLRRQRHKEEPTVSLSDIFPVLKFWGL